MCRYIDSTATVTLYIMQRRALKLDVASCYQGNMKKKVFVYEKFSICGMPPTVKHADIAFVINVKEADRKFIPTMILISFGKTREYNNSFPSDHVTP